LLSLLLHNAHLYLPTSELLAKQSRLSPDVFNNCLSIPTTSAFERVWINGPSASHFSDDLCLLCTTLSQFVISGKGKTKVATKSDPLDLVTDVDRGIELLLRLWITTFFPTHKIIGEEGAKDSLSPEDFTWYIDPVDGTTNFVEGRNDVSVHIACIARGTPFWGFLGLPLKDTYYVFDGKKSWIKTANQTLFMPFSLKINNEAASLGTECMDSQVDEHHRLATLSRTLSLTPLRTRSIGVTLSKFFTSELKLFYKDNVKLWDIMAPLTILFGAAPHLYQYDFWIPNARGKCFNLFSNDAILYSHFNRSHAQNDCHAGLCLVYPKIQHDSADMILRSFL